MHRPRPSAVAILERAGPRLTSWVLIALASAACDPSATRLAALATGWTASRSPSADLASGREAFDGTRTGATRAAGLLRGVVAATPSAPEPWLLLAQASGLDPLSDTEQRDRLMAALGLLERGGALAPDQRRELLLGRALLLAGGGRPTEARAMAEQAVALGASGPLPDLVLAQTSLGFDHPLVRSRSAPWLGHARYGSWARYLHAQASLRLGDLATALRLTADDRGAAELAELAGRVAYAQGDLAGAVSRWRAQAPLLAARALWRQAGQIEAARRLLGSSPDEPRAPIEEALLPGSEGDHAALQARLTDIARSRPPLAALAAYAGGVLALGRGDHAAAATAAARAAQLVPERPEPWLLAALAGGPDSGQGSPAAPLDDPTIHAQLARLGAERFPAHAALCHATALLAYRLGQAPVALGELRRCATFDPEADAARHLLDDWHVPPLLRERLTRAAAALVAARPEDLAPRLLLAHTSLAAGELPRAEALAAELLRDAPEEAGPRVLAGLLAQRRGAHALALSQLTAAARLDRFNSAAQLAALASQHALGQARRALPRAQAFVEANPFTLQARVLLARMQLALRQGEPARQTLAPVLDLDPFEPGALALLAQLGPSEPARR